MSKKPEQVVNPFNQSKGHKWVKSDIPSNLVKEKLVTGNMTSMSKLFTNSKQKFTVKNTKFSGNSYVVSSSKEDSHLIKSNKSSSNKLKTIQIISNQNIQSKQ